MGEVLPLRRTKCPCGWELPRYETFSVGMDNVFGGVPPTIETIRLGFSCPRCGHEMETTLSDLSGPQVGERA